MLTVARSRAVGCEAERNGFRAQYGPGFPAGYEAQVNNTDVNPQRTGSLYGFVEVTEQLVPDDTWWTQHVIFKGNHIRIRINGTEVVNFVDADDTHTNGYFALQQFHPGTVVQFRNLMIRRLESPTGSAASESTNQ